MLSLSRVRPVPASLMDRAADASEADLAAGAVSVADVALVHKFADPQRVDITIELGGARQAERQQACMAAAAAHACQQRSSQALTRGPSLRRWHARHGRPAPAGGCHAQARGV